jgi:hypothetical protein
MIETFSYALERIAEKGDAQTRENITERITAWITSKWMTRETNENSSIFRLVITHCGRIMQAAQNTEAKEATHK